MHRQITLQTEPIDEKALIDSRQIPGSMGAVATFSGVVRGTEGALSLAGIEYEAFPEMVHHQFGLLLNAIEQRWAIESIRLVHRIGFVPTNQPSLWVEVVAAHRAEAFQAIQYLIDEMKRVVPIWKKPVALPHGTAGPVS